MLESLFNKFAGLKARNYIKKRLQHRLVFCEYFLFRASFLQNTSRRMFLKEELRFK